MRIIEITPAGRTAYDMPAEVFDLVAYALQVNAQQRRKGGGRGVRECVALLPQSFRDQVTITEMPKQAEPATGWQGDIIIDEEVAP